MLDKLMKTGAEEIEKAAIAREIATNSGLSDKGVHIRVSQKTKSPNFGTQLTPVVFIG